jgi:hypothetical protein
VGESFVSSACTRSLTSRLTRANGERTFRTDGESFDGLIRVFLKDSGRMEGDTELKAR